MYVLWGWIQKASISFFIQMHLKHFLFYHLVCIEFIFYTKFLFFFSFLSVLAQGHVLFVQFCSGPCFVCTILCICFWGIIQHATIYMITTHPSSKVRWETLITAIDVHPGLEDMCTIAWFKTIERDISQNPVK